MTRTNFKAQAIAYGAGRLMDSKDTNGRELRDYVADDCYVHGGWLAPVGWWIDNPAGKKTVGEVYSETMLGLSFMAFHGPWEIWMALSADPTEVENRPQPGDEFDANRWEPEEPHFGRYHNHFEQYAAQVEKATAKKKG